MQENAVDTKEGESKEKNWDELLMKAQSCKDEGNKCYTSGKLEDAIEFYTRAIEYMIQELKEDEREPELNQSPTDTNANTDQTPNSSDSKVEPVDRLKETPKRLSPLQMKHPSQYHSEVAIFYGNRAACYLYKEYHEETIKDCSDAIELDPKYVKAYLRRASANEKSNKFSNSMRAYELDSSLKMAKEAAQRLEPLAKEEQEREKAEMMAKLKDLGNSFLGLFGLSTDNFQFTQDPNSGGYSVNFKR